MPIRQGLYFGLLFILLAGRPLFGQSAEDTGPNWPQFRGPAAAGIGSGSPPVNWDVETGENVAWKVSVPGLGHASPVVWGNDVFLTTAVNDATDSPTLSTGWVGGTGDPAEDEGEWRWKALCFDLTSGDLKWERELAKGVPTIKRHLKATHANGSVATNGKQVVCFFGSEGLYCLDRKGTLLWKKDFGKLHSGPYNAETLEWGFASSPIIHGEEVIVQCDCLNVGFVAVLNLADGTERLRIPRDDVASWSTPAIVTAGGRSQIVCNGYRQMSGYDFTTGEELWTLNGGGDVPVPTPLFANGLIYLTNGHGRSPTYAIRPDARGDLTPPSDDASDGEDAELPSGLAWWQPRDGSYMPTPIVIGDRLYTCNDNGRLTVRDALTGEMIYRQRIAGSSATYSASAVGTADRIYLCAENGDVTVFQTGDQYDRLASNSMDAVIMASPALAGNRLLIRTLDQLICLEEGQHSEGSGDDESGDDDSGDSESGDGRSAGTR